MFSGKRKCTYLSSEADNSRLHWPSKQMLVMVFWWLENAATKRPPPRISQMLIILCPNKRKIIIRDTYIYISRLAMHPLISLMPASNGQIFVKWKRPVLTWLFYEFQCHICTVLMRNMQISHCNKSLSRTQFENIHKIIVYIICLI